MNTMVKNSIVLSTILLMILASVSTTTSAIIKSSNEIEPLGNTEILNITMPDIHVYPYKLGFRYPKVEFNESDVIDVNISGFTGNEISIDFIQNIYVHTENQLLPTRYLILFGIYDEYDSIVVGSGYGYYIGFLKNWHDIVNANVSWNTSIEGNYSYGAWFTALPQWLPFFDIFHLEIDSWRWFKVISFPKIFGGEVTYQLDIHK